MDSVKRKLQEKRILVKLVEKYERTSGTYKKSISYLYGLMRTSSEESYETEGLTKKWQFELIREDSDLNKLVGCLRDDYLTDFFLDILK